MNSEQQYIDLFRAHRDLLEQHAAPVTNRPREEAAALLEQQGLPDRKTERYKYTDARAAFAPNFGVNLKRLLPKANPYDTFRCQVPNLSTSLFFVLNDVPVPAPLHTQSLLPEGVTVDSFSRVGKKRPGWLEAFYHRAASHERDFKTGHDGVTLLNTMLAQDGLLIHVPAGVKLKTPIQVVNMSVAASDFLSLRRVLIVAEEDAEVSVLFCEHAEGAPAYLTSEVMEVYGGVNSSVSLYSIEETNERCTAFRNIFTEQQSGSRVTCHSVTLTCGTSRTRLDARLKGEGAVCEAFGAVIADDTRRVDHNVLVEHLTPGCQSDMLYKYVLDGSSVGAFAGKVYVAPGADKTLSRQTHASLCASPTSRAFSQPMLEIYADDVSCNHGSTTGKLDEAALFYMRQRGIPEAEARLLLQHAFINEVLRHVSIPHLYDRLAFLTDQRFRGALRHCQGCHRCGVK